MSAMPPLPLPARGLVPHEPPLRLVETLVSCGGGSAIVEARLGEGHLLLDGVGELEPSGFLELLAQAYALFKGYEDRASGGEVGLGYLVGVQRLEVHGPAKGGETLTIRVRETGVIGSFFLAEGEVYRGEALLAEGSLRLWCPP